MFIVIIKSIHYYLSNEKKRYFNMNILISYYRCVIFTEIN